MTVPTSPHSYSAAPTSFGATALSRLINGQHFLVYSLMAVVMLIMGASMAVGFKVPIPIMGCVQLKLAGWCEHSCSGCSRVWPPRAARPFWPGSLRYRAPQRRS